MENHNELHLEIGLLRIELDEIKQDRDFWIRNSETIHLNKEKDKEILKEVIEKQQKEIELLNKYVQQLNEDFKTVDEKQQKEIEGLRISLEAERGFIQNRKSPVDGFESTPTKGNENGSKKVCL